MLGLCNPTIRTNEERLCFGAASAVGSGEFEVALAWEGFA